MPKQLSLGVNGANYTISPWPHDEPNPECYRWIITRNGSRVGGASEGVHALERIYAQEFEENGAGEFRACAS